jgi:hypothetical protein
MPLLVAGSEVAEVVSDQFDACEIVHRFFPSEAGLSDILRDPDGEVGLTHDGNSTYRWVCIKFDELSFMFGLTSGPYNKG